MWRSAARDDEVVVRHFKVPRVAVVGLVALSGWLLAVGSEPSTVHQLTQMPSRVANSTSVAYANAASVKLDFGANPAPLPNGARRAYFNLLASPGQVLHEVIQVTNSAPFSQHLDLFRVAGLTSPNSGYTYSAPSRACIGAGCWIKGLTGSVLLPAASGTGPSSITRKTVSFLVRVPTSVLPGQYLAGITVEPPLSHAPVVTQRKGARVELRSRLAFRVTVGIAVTIGPPSALHSRLVLTRVYATLPPLAERRGVALLAVVEKDTGNTFDFPDGGEVEVETKGGTKSYPLSSSTMLPGGTATLEVPTVGMEPGAYPAKALLYYDDKAKVATWSGTLEIPAAPVVTIVKKAGTTLVVKGGRGPSAWVIAALAGLGGLVLLLVLALCWLVLLRRKRDKEEQRSKDASFPGYGGAPAGIGPPVARTPPRWDPPGAGNAGQD